jgi:hypothetical protein
MFKKASKAILFYLLKPLISLTAFLRFLVRPKTILRRYLILLDNLELF